MNSYIERIEALPYSVWHGMQISTLQAALLIIVVAGFGYWLLEKQKLGAWTSISGLLIFTALRSFSFYQSDRQHKLIIYNVPKHQAMDIINGRNYYFIGDSDLLTDDFARNFHLKPSRVLNRIQPIDHVPNFSKEIFLQESQKRILLIDKNCNFDSCVRKIPIDLLIISKSPNPYLSKLSKTFSIKQIVFDGSVTAWRINTWKKVCDSLHIPYWNVNDKGAFVMSLN